MAQDTSSDNDQKIDSADQTALPSEPQPASEQAALRQLPATQLVLPVVPIREGVLFPNTESVLTFGRSLSLAAIQASVRSQNLVVLLTQRKINLEKPGPADLYEVGTLAMVERTLKSDDQINALVRGIGRVKIMRYVKTEPVLLAQVSRLEDRVERDEELKALTSHLQKEFRKAVHLGKPVEFLNFMKLMSGVNEGELADQISSTLDIKTRDKQKLLEQLEVKERIRQIIAALVKERRVLEIEKDLNSKTQAKFDKHMRENVLRERMRTIQKELGELDDDEEVIGEYEQKLKKMKFSEEAREKVAKEIKRLKQMSVNNPESGYVRTWLDTMFELPWGVRSDQKVDLQEVEKILSKNHSGLKEVKDRVLEYMAVLQLKQAQAKDRTAQLPTILCFVGPPGVGKTSIGQSIAEALGRSFGKVALGGIRDEAEVRGHRRTYVGAMPGRIVNVIKQAKTINPVVILDEIDKVGTDFRGDPSSALLEVLDPEQNKKFEDHYLDVPFDLSEVIFIATANTLDTIPPALRDRLEIIRYSGYTQEEKFRIAKDHLWQKVLTANGLSEKQIKLSDTTLEFIIQRYTREAGVRNLERTLSQIMRKVARDLLSQSKLKSVNVDQKLVKKYLGPEKFDMTLAENLDQIGLATGLAWTELGGDVLFIEVALTPGKGQIKLTGKLGDVMKESAQAALTYVKAHAGQLGIDEKIIAERDVHIHVPEGAVPKDGPSAGITITTAIVSAFSNRPVKKDIAMTGEVTLRGRVLRIGGLKEKSIAARQAGVKTVIIPQENERDIQELPESVRKDLKFIPVDDVQKVLELAVSPTPLAA